MDKRTKTWLSIVVAILIVVVMLGAAAIGGAAYFVFSHFRQTAVEEPQAVDRFQEVRQLLPDRPPLLTLDERDEVVVNRSEGVAGGARLQTLRAMIYDAREERIVEVDIPFWLLRMMPSGGRLSFLDDSGVRFNSERTRLTLEDLERHGAGVVLDHRDERGAWILVWTE